MVGRRVTWQGAVSIIAGAELDVGGRRATWEGAVSALFVYVRVFVGACVYMHVLSSRISSDSQISYAKTIRKS